MKNTVPVQDPREILSDFFSDPPATLEGSPALAKELGALSDRLEKYEYLAPYLFHPSAPVRREAARLCVDIDAGGIDYFLVNTLADTDAAVGQQAAAALWQRGKRDECEYAVKSLRDEIRGHNSRGRGVGDLGRDRARQALRVLVQVAPDQAARDRLLRLIREEIGADYVPATTAEGSARASAPGPNKGASSMSTSGGSDKIRFTCATCHGTLNAPLSLVEKTVQCPKCKAKLIVPYPQAAADDELSESLPEAELAPTRQKPGPAPAPSAAAKPKKRRVPEPPDEPEEDQEDEEEEEEDEEEVKPRKKGFFSRLFGKEPRSAKQRSSLGGDYAARARALLGKEAPQEQKLADNSSYRDAKIKEYTALCKMAVEACEKAGQRGAIAGVQKIQTVCMLLMGGWSGMRPLIVNDPTQRLWLVGVALMLSSGWKIMTGLVQVFGLDETSKDYPSEAKLLEDFGHVVGMAEQIQQKMGLG